MRTIAQCHGYAFRYPAIKSWFLDQYPEIADFGITVIPMAAKDTTDDEEQPAENVSEMKQAS